MTAKEYLSEVQRLQTIIEQKQERIKEIRESVSTVRGVRFDLEKVHGSGRTDKIGDSVTKIIDLETEVENDMISIIYRKHEIIEQIHALGNYRYIQLLYKRYIEFKRLQIVAAEMDFTYEYVLELHKKALKAFEVVNKEVLQKENRRQA